MKKNLLHTLDEQFIMKGNVCKVRDYQKDVVKQVLDINAFSPVVYLSMDGGTGKTLIVRLVSNSTSYSGNTLYTAVRTKIVNDAREDFNIDYKDLDKPNRRIRCVTLQTIYELAKKFYEVSDQNDFEIVKRDKPLDLDDNNEMLFGFLKDTKRVALDEFQMFGTQENNKMVNTIKVFFKEYFDIKLWMPISATMWPVSMELFGDPKGITATYDSAELERQGYLNPADIISIETGRALTTNSVGTDT